MKATAKLLAAAVAVGGLGLAMEAEADRGRGGHGARGHGGHWNQGHRHWGHGHGHWRGGWGLWLGAPLVFGAAYGWPYYYDYPRETIIYREREVFPEGTIEPAPEATTQVPRGEGAPSQGPLYMNYCESARAYFPKVTTCPEGWKLATPTN
jgi:hypothetical protein